MNLLFDSLVRRGVITDQDMATAQLQSDLKLAQRRLKVAVECGDREAVENQEASIKDLAAKIEALAV